MLEKNKEYLLYSANLGKTKDGRVFGVFTLVDGDIKERLNVWGITQLPTVPSIIVISKMKSGEGFQSCSLGDIEIKSCPKDHPLMKYFPVIVSRQRWDIMRTSIEEEISDSSLKSVWMEISDRLYVPYSKRIGGRSMHHAYSGGLLNHTYEILNMYIGLTGFLPFKINTFIFAISALFHDYYKLSEYDDDNNTMPAMNLIGHPAGSYEAVGLFLRNKGVDKKIIMCVQHCVLSHHGMLEHGSPVLPCNEEALLLSRLDELSATGEMIAKTPSGGKCKDVTVYHYRDL